MKFVKKYNLYASDTLNFFSIGYSEGGGYSIWSAKCLGWQGNCQGVNKLGKLYKYRAAADLSGDFMIDKICST